MSEGEILIPVDIEEPEEIKKAPSWRTPSISYTKK